ncbi:unnamed protein product [Meloidogyne enterolobii]|uniref:Uncharacterized protein n=1 Tax=Meloidogyne enterolobii TaxID=390850 RepID=A0ACB1A7Q8_MELEN
MIFILLQSIFRFFSILQTPCFPFNFYFKAKRRKLIEEEEKAKLEGLISSDDSDPDADSYISARQRRREQEHRRLLLRNLIHSKVTEAQADKDLQRETEEFLAAKRRKKEEEKKLEESKKSLLEKHNELLQQEQGYLLGFLGVF